MTSRLVQVLLLLYLSTGGMASRGITCYIKSDNTKTFNGLLSSYSFRTCSGLFSCSCGRAIGRTVRWCTDRMPKLTREYIKKNICNKMQHKLTATGIKVPIYLSGKADCAGNSDTNSWMDPAKKADVCCAAVPFYGVIGCKKGVDRWCQC